MAPLPPGLARLRVLVMSSLFAVEAPEALAPLPALEVGGCVLNFPTRLACVLVLVAVCAALHSHGVWTSAHSLWSAGPAPVGARLRYGTAPGDVGRGDAGRGKPRRGCGTREAGEAERCTVVALRLVVRFFTRLRRSC